ncbi:MAG TPA: DNA repair protein RecN [Chthoniobacterales bacterium]|nr:DNA repair protein RecN [Chthoniobacterales bacterium]
MPATLRSLRIRNLALVEFLDWELEPGFTVVTGETGAGKSIILGALKLLLGERADKTLIRTGAEQCSVEGLFEIADPVRVNELLSEQGIDPCEGDQLLLRRLLATNGTNRQFINGCQTTLSVLKEVGDGLVDLHGPHDHQSLLAREYQLRLVDAFGGSEEVYHSFRETFERLRSLRGKLEQLESENAVGNLELWQHQWSEIRDAAIQVGELEALEAKYALASNAHRILELTSLSLLQLADAEDSILTRLGDIARTLRELERLDPGSTELTRNHERGTVELEELERDLRHYQEKIEVDPGSLRQLEERLNLLESLRRKYHRNEEELLALAAELEEKLGQIDGRESALEKLRADVESTSQKMQAVGRDLTAARATAGERLARQIRVHLADLGFQQARFDLEWETLGEPISSGFDQIEFLFSPNPGEPLKPLRAIASSGEISRVMLAIKTALAQQDLIGLLVFDEIDANVGGEIAHAVGRKMQTLGENHQVLAITHMPQVAAAARKHFFVSKEVSDGRTRTALQEVGGPERLEEIARMLGGKSRSALEHARTLLTG